MIDELIENEKNSLLQEKQEYLQLKKNLDYMKKKILEFEKAREKIKFEISMLSNPSKPKEKNFNVFQRWFSRGYKNYLKSQEEYEAKLENVQKKREQLNDELEKLNQKIREIQEKIASYTQRISDTNIEEIEEQLTTLEDRETAAELLLKKHPEYSDNVDFMKEAIKVKTDLIAYDKTNDQQLYLEVIDRYKQSYIDEHGIDSNVQLLERFKKEIINPEQVEEGTYKVPTQFIYEAIRSSFISDGIEMLQQATCYFEVNGKISRELGEQMQAMWEDEDTYFVVHGVGRNFETAGSGARNIASAEKSVDSIFQQGLKATNSMGELTGKNITPDLAATAFIQGRLSFINALAYQYAGSYGYVVMQIPREGLGKDATKAIWGMKTNESDRRERVFLLPKYIKGFVVNNIYTNQREREFRPNNTENMEEYMYFLMDSSYVAHMDAIQTESIVEAEAER